MAYKGKWGDKKHIVDTGNHAVSYAVRLARVGVVSAYPITPQSQVIEEIARMIDVDGMECEYIPVESEHSAMAALISSTAMGVRSFSATSAHGLAYMHELLHWAVLIRLPIVLVNVNRALGPGWNIWCDQQDSISARDTGFIQLYCSSHQEILDTVLMAFRITEDPSVFIPVMVNYDAFVISHSYMQIHIPSQEEADRFLPPFNTSWKLDIKNPVTHGSVVYPDDYEELRKSLQESHDKSYEIINRVDREYMEIIGRGYGGLFETYMLEDADFAIVSMGGLASECKVAVDYLRGRGEKFGLMRIKAFRPFPGKQMLKELERVKCIFVLDRSYSFGNEGPIATELKAVAHDLGFDVPIYGMIGGLGGKDVPYKVIAERASDVAKKKVEAELPMWITLRINEHHEAARKAKALFE